MFVVSSDGARREVPLPAGSGAIVSIGVSADGKRVALGTRAHVEADRLDAALAVAGPALVFQQSGGVFRLQASMTMPAVALVCAFNPRTQDLAAGAVSAQVGVAPPGSTDIMGDFRAPDAEGRAHHGPVRGLALTPDGRLLYTLAEREQEWEVRTWNYDTQKLRGPALHAPGRPRSLDLSPDGNVLLIGTEDRGVLLRVVGR